MAPFIYTPLKKPKSEIRLFELFPGQGQVRGCLSNFDLEVIRGTYDALSYCWGEQKQTVTVIINNCTWSTGKNLYDALKSIRKSQGRVMLWIDAVCINQNDTQEKNAQVSIMKDVYSNGRKTYVWLGLDNIWTSLAFQEMEMRAKWIREQGSTDNVGWRLWQKRYMALEKANTNWLARIMGRFDYLDWASRSILTRPWFSRCWVIQEIATSKSITVICGKYQIDWNDLETVQIARPGIDELCTLVSIRQRVNNANMTHLESLLWGTNTFQTTDARDRIFSLLGLISHDSDKSSDSIIGNVHDTVRVDYSASIRDVYMKATIHCMTDTSSAGILAASIGLQGTCFGVFPSWVLHPEPSREDRQGRSTFAWTRISDDPQSETIWKAAGSSICLPRFDSHSCRLGLQGMIVDIVDLVGAEREEISGSQSTVRLRGMTGHVKTGVSNIKCYFQWRELSGVGFEKFYRGTNKTTEEAFLEIMCPRLVSADGNYNVAAERRLELSRRFDQFMTTTFGFMEHKIHGKLRKRELAQIVSKCARVVGEAGLGDREDVAAAADFESNNDLSSTRCFVRTKNHYIGLGGRHVAIGDNVVLLAGSPAPFLVRASSSGQYRIVSDAYFVGMMDGELWDPQSCGIIWLE